MPWLPKLLASTRDGKSALAPTGCSCHNLLAAYVNGEERMRLSRMLASVFLAEEMSDV